MSSTNQGPEYFAAEKQYANAQNIRDKIYWLEEMIKSFKKHKGSEKMLANLKTRLIKIKEKQEKLGRSGKQSSGKAGIKKEEMQAAIVGFTNSGKSTLISLLTNTNPEIANYSFTTKQPIVGMMSFSGMQIQLIEVPAIGSEYYDKGIPHTADTILILVNKLEDIDKIEKIIGKVSAQKVIVFNNKEGLNERKIDATLRSRKLNYVLINTEANEGLEELKEKIFKSFNKIRVFTKEPGKVKSDKPIMLNPGSTVKDVAEKIFHGFSKKIKDSFVTGPSSKFPNQRVGLTHFLKDMDVVEFKTR